MDIPNIPQPALRPLKIFPTDPTQGYARARRAVIEIENEDLETGPSGERVEVVDYDGYTKKFYAQVNLDDPGDSRRWVSALSSYCETSGRRAVDLHSARDN